MANHNDLLHYIFDGQRHTLYAPFDGWLKASRRFGSFAARHQNKIRAKVKNSRDPHGIADLGAELETAFIRLREQRFALAYGRYAATKQRGPDFTVTFKTHTRFNIEVRRLRTIDERADDESHRLMALLCDKIGQMPLSIINMWLTGEQAPSQTRLTHATRELRRLAADKAQTFLGRHGFKDTTDFLRRYNRLSAIIWRQMGARIIWLNSSVRHKTPPDLVKAIEQLDLL